jgi:glucose-1-phosphate thymidylyltransferase
MKGVILAGGTGSRLMPLTKVHNKATLPIGDKPMIYHSLEKMKNLGITEIIVIIGKEQSGDIINHLGSGEEFGVKIFYVIQEKPTGIPSAIALTKEFIGNDKFLVILSDNIFDDDLKSISKVLKSGDCAIFTTLVDDPSRFGVLTKVKTGKFGRKYINYKIVEKPTIPESNEIATGVYLFDEYFWTIFPKLKPSQRLETEIADVINEYFKKNKIKVIRLTGNWTDVGTLESYWKVNQEIKNYRLTTATLTVKPTKKRFLKYEKPVVTLINPKSLVKKMHDCHKEDTAAENIRLRLMRWFPSPPPIVKKSKLDIWFDNFINTIKNIGK